MNEERFDLTKYLDIKFPKNIYITSYSNPIGMLPIRKSLDLQEYIIINDYYLTQTKNDLIQTKNNEDCDWLIIK